MDIERDQMGGSDISAYDVNYDKYSTDLGDILGGNLSANKMKTLVSDNFIKTTKDSSKKIANAIKDKFITDKKDNNELIKLIDRKINILKTVSQPMILEKIRNSIKEYNSLIKSPSYGALPTTARNRLLIQSTSESDKAVQELLTKIHQAQSKINEYKARLAKNPNDSYAKEKLPYFQNAIENFNQEIQQLGGLTKLSFEDIVKIIKGNKEDDAHLLNYIWTELKGQKLEEVRIHSNRNDPNKSNIENPAKSFDDLHTDTTGTLRAGQGSNQPNPESINRDVQRFFTAMKHGNYAPLYQKVKTVAQKLNNEIVDYITISAVIDELKKKAKNAHDTIVKREKKDKLSDQELFVILGLDDSELPVDTKYNTSIDLPTQPIEEPKMSQAAQEPQEPTLPDEDQQLQEMRQRSRLKPGPGKVYNENEAKAFIQPTDIDKKEDSKKLLKEAWKNYSNIHKDDKNNETPDKFTFLMG